MSFVLKILIPNQTPIPIIIHRANKISVTCCVSKNEENIISTNTKIIILPASKTNSETGNFLISSICGDSMYWNHVISNNPL